MRSEVHAPGGNSIDSGTAGDAHTRWHVPAVTIGLAVYNGEMYLEEAIQSILAQTFRDFELVICDNASSDSTAEICARHVARDSRIRYYRNPINIGGVRNENRTMFLARGRYFKLAAHDDKIASQFLEKCVAVLEMNPEVEVCTTGAFIIDSEGRVIESRAAPAGTEERLHHRIRSIARTDYACEATYGVMRMHTLREVRPQTNHLHSDRVVLTELALRRAFHLVEEPLLFKRIFESFAHRDPFGRMAWFQPELALTGAIRLPNWQQAADYVTMLGRSRMTWSERLRCAVEIICCFWRTRRDMVMDVAIAFQMLLRGKEARRQRYLDESKWR